MKFYLLLLFLIMISCRSDKSRNKEYVNTIVKEWTGKKIVFPTNIPMAILGRDTICDEILKSQVKILVYVDSAGCAACKLNLYDWNQKIDSLSNNKEVNFLFFVYTKNYKSFSNRVKGEVFKYPIFYDKQNELENMNRFPKDNHFQTFLLDSSNRVVLVGTPLGNRAMWDLYKREINRLTEE